MHSENSRLYVKNNNKYGWKKSKCIKLFQTNPEYFGEIVVNSINKIIGKCKFEGDIYTCIFCLFKDNTYCKNYNIFCSFDID